MRRLVLCLFAVACGGGGGGGAKPAAEEPKPVVANVPPEKPEGPPPVAGEVGVAPCDEYIARFRRCARSMEPAAQGAIEQAVQTLLDGWRQTAEAGPAAREALEEGCRQALEEARTAYTSMCPGVF